MSDAERLAELRELFLGAAIPASTQVITLVGSLALAAIVVWLVRRRGLREEYTPIWLAVAIALPIITVDFDVLIGLTRTIGAWTPSSTVFFLGEVFLVAICLNYAVRLSRQSAQIKNLAQEVALLRWQVQRTQSS